MVNAVDFEKIEGFPNIGRWAFFAGMGKEMQALGARRFKDARKLRRWVPNFAGIKADAKDMGQIRLCRF